MEWFKIYLFLQVLLNIIFWGVLIGVKLANFLNIKIGGY